VKGEQVPEGRHKLEPRMPVFLTRIRFDIHSPKIWARLVAVPAFIVEREKGYARKDRLPAPSNCHEDVKIGSA